MAPAYESDRAAVLIGDCREQLNSLPAGVARTCVTSPPYYGLRDYGVDGQIGLEQSPEDYVNALVDVFRAVRRTLTDDGTLWLNLGDSYASRPGRGLKAKDLIGIPWMVAFALRADCWYLRSEIIWHKPNPLPDGAKDRPSRAHEHLLLLTKDKRYYYDAKAIHEPAICAGRKPTGNKKVDASRGDAKRDMSIPVGEFRNKRDVWTLAPTPFRGAHFATMPRTLVEPCVLAGSAPGDIVLDPFAGSGTTGLVALQHGRRFLGTELNPEYGEIAAKRLHEAEFATSVEQVE